MLKLNNISAKAADKEVLHNFSYEFEKGKIYAIMGPNGSGKSTLASSIMGSPTFEVTGEILLSGENITELEPNKRAEAGIFLSFQSPLALSGVRVYQLLLLAMSGKLDALSIRRKAQEVAKKLHISEELLGRSLNEGASGGERKKMEVLQAAVLDKPVQIFDEVDTGVDVDALKRISEFLYENKADKTYIVITHYNRILHYLKPDVVLVIMKGNLVKTGGPELAEKIEKEGYDKL